MYIFYAVSLLYINTALHIFKNIHKQKFLKDGLKIKKKTSIFIFHFINVFDSAILAGSQFPD